MSGEPKTDESIEGVIAQVAAAEGAGSDDFSPDDMKALANRVDLLTADIGRWESYKAASTEYVEAFTAEVNWHRKVRLWVTIGAGLLMAFLLLCIVIALCKGDSLFGQNHYALTVLIAGSITGCVIVGIALVKGAYSNLAERNAGLPMPDHIKEIIDVGKSMIGR